MKHLHLFTLILLLFFASCSTESAGTADESNTYLSRNLVSDPSNSSNPFDVAGKLHRNLVETYILKDLDIMTIEHTIAQVELLAHDNLQFLDLKPLNYSAPSPERLSYMLRPNALRINEIITLSSLSSQGKSKLQYFFRQLDSLQQENADFEPIYSTIVDYETDIILSHGYTETDLRILLTTSAIARYGYSMKKGKIKRRDRDWELSIGTFLTGSDGANQNVAEAIAMSVASSIVVNQ